MRAFVRLREMLAAHKELERKLANLEMKYDKQFKVVFDAIRALMSPTERTKRRIGFEVKEPPGVYKKKNKPKKKKWKSGCRQYQVIY